MRNAESQNCLDTLGRKGGENLGMSYCHGLGGNQVCLAFFIPCSSKLLTQITHIYSVLFTVLYIIVQVFAYTKRQQIMSDDNCLDASSPEGPVKLVRCHGMGGNQAWTYSTQVFVLPLHCFCFYDCASKHDVFTQTNNVAWKLWVYLIEVCAWTERVRRLHFRNWCSVQVTELFIVHYSIIYRNLFQCILSRGLWFCWGFIKIVHDGQYYSLLDLFIRAKHFLWNMG